MTDKHSEEQEKAEQPASKTMAVSGIIVLVAMGDGSIRQAEVTEAEHLKTILTICSMNDKKALKLGKTDFKPILDEHLEGLDGSD